jgi:type II secretory pathway component PulL
MENSVDTKSSRSMTTTTVAPQPLLVPQPKLSCPYARHVLSAFTPTLRANLAPTVSVQGWNDFWTRVQPVATLADQELWRIMRVQLYLIALFLVCIIASTVIAAWYVHSHDRHHHTARWTSSIVNWIVFLAPVLPLFYSVPTRSYYRW